MLGSEEMFEYYHILHLANGTVLDRPAGRCGFLTEPQPNRSKSAGSDASAGMASAQLPLSAGEDVELRQPFRGVTHLRSPKNASAVEPEAESDADMMWMSSFGRDQGPGCVSAPTAPAAQPPLQGCTE